MIDGISARARAVASLEQNNEETDQTSINSRMQLCWMHVGHVFCHWRLQVEEGAWR